MLQCDRRHDKETVPGSAAQCCAPTSHLLRLVTPCFRAVRVPEYRKGGMNENVAKTAFALVGLGTVGLLANEFALSWGRIATLMFAALSLVGLVALGLARWRRGGDNASARIR